MPKPVLVPIAANNTSKLPSTSQGPQNVSNNGASVATTTSATIEQSTYSVNQNSRMNSVETLSSSQNNPLRDVTNTSIMRSKIPGSQNGQTTSMVSTRLIQCNQNDSAASVIDQCVSISTERVNCQTSLTYYCIALTI